MACSSANESCIQPSPSSVPATLPTTTLDPATNLSLYANESCLAKPHAKLEVVSNKKQEEEEEKQEGEEVDERERATSGVGKEEQPRPEEPSRTQMQATDYNEAQENVRMSVLAEPDGSLDDDLSGPRNSSSFQLAHDYSSGAECCGAPDNEANQRRQQPLLAQSQSQRQVQSQSQRVGQEDEGEEDEEMERRLFGLSLTDEMRKQLRKQRFKLFSRAHLKKRKRKRQPGSGTVPTSGESRAKPSERLKSALTRQGTTTANYADLGQDIWLQEMQNNFHSINKPAATPLVQKLFGVDKLSQSSSNSHLVGHQMLSDHQTLAAGHPRLLLSPTLDTSNNADLLNSWAAGDPTGARSALVKHAQSKMIPIEIIGLDPQVTKSILQADTPPDETGLSNFASDSSMDNPTLAAAYQTRSRPSKTSILHVHHFHTSRPLLSQSTLPVSNAVTLETRPQQHTSRQLSLRQAFLNEAGEIVYLDPSATGSGMNKLEPHFISDPLDSALHLNTISGQDVSSNKLSYPAHPGGAMVQYVPAGSQISQQTTLLNKQESLGSTKQRFFVTSNGQTVSIMSPQAKPDDSHSQQVSGQPHEPSDDKMLMVAYRPQQSGANGANHSIEESLVNKYNEGQESKASMVSASGLVLRPLSGLIQSLVPHPLLRGAPNFTGLDMSNIPSHSASIDDLGGSDRVKLHPASGPKSVPSVPSTSLRQYSHHEPDLMIKGPPPVDSQRFWLGGPSEPLLNSFHNSPTIPVPSFRNNSHLLTGLITNDQPNQKISAGSRPVTNGTLTAPSQDFLRKLLKGLQLQKDSGQNLTLSSAQQLATIKGISLQPAKHLIRDINQPPASRHSNRGKLQDSSQQSLPIRNQPSIGSSNEAALKDLSATNGDADGLGITLAFISMVSLLTLILIAGAASMLYRHRRRSSVSRCASLPVRTRLNLTHRTKRFMRSNFVRPDQGITPIKRVDLDSNCSSPAAKLASPRPPPAHQDHLSPLESISAAKPTTGDAHKPNKPTGVSAQLLSTFNGNQTASHHGTTTPTADIKTLNTRLQKSSYLKSLISGASCMPPLSCSSGQKQQHAGAGGGAHKLANNVDAAVCYLGSSNNNNSNCRQQSDARILAPDGGKGCSIADQRSHSFKNLSSSSCDHNYSFTRKPGSADRNSIDSKHFNINRLPTIYSESDNNLHSSKFTDSDSSSQHQFKQRDLINSTCRSNELHNPSRHHITEKFLMEQRL